MNLLVTGATGFIGQNLVRYICRQGYRLRVFCRPTSDVSGLLNQPVRIAYGDIQDPSSVDQAAGGCDYIFHLAGYARNWARDPEVFYRVNVAGTRNVLQAARKAKVKKVVVTSTSMTLGPSRDKPQAETSDRMGDFFCDYERTKFYAEQLVADFVKDGLPVVLVHPTRVFGPGLITEGNTVTRMIQLYLKRKWRLILGDGSAVGNYAFVEDVVQGHWLALQKGQPGEKYVLGGESLSYNAFFDILAELSHRHYRMVHVPLWMALVFSKVEIALARTIGIYPLITPDWVRVFVRDWDFSSEKAQKELGYRITPFREALQKTLAWINQKKNSSDGS